MSSRVYVWRPRAHEPIIHLWIESEKASLCGQVRYATMNTNRWALGPIPYEGRPCELCLKKDTDALEAAKKAIDVQGMRSPDHLDV